MPTGCRTLRGTFKDMYVDSGGRDMVPFLKVLATLIGRGVEIRLIHAKEPGPNFREDFDRYPRLFTQMERVLCPRVHFKCVIVDDAVWRGDFCKDCGRKDFCGDPVV